jgi:predicted ester cyclase
MKKLVFAVSAFICIYLVACTNDANSGNDKNISTARDILKGIETGDSAKLAAIAPDAVDHAGPMGDITSGDSIKGSLLEMHNRIKDLKFEILGDAASGDYVYTWNKMTGTPLDSTMGFTPNQPFSISGVDVIRFRDGKVVEHWGTIDQKDLMMIRAQQMPNATTVKVTLGDSSNNKKDTTRR